MSCQLEFLPVAKQDLVEIAEYISKTLQNPKAAKRLAQTLLERAEDLCPLPYAYPVYQPIRPLRQEYRKVTAGHYLLFYTVSEETKTVTVARTLYGRRNLTTKMG